MFISLIITKANVNCVLGKLYRDIPWYCLFKVVTRMAKKKFLLLRSWDFRLKKLTQKHINLNKSRFQNIVILLDIFPNLSKFVKVLKMCDNLCNFAHSLL